MFACIVIFNLLGVTRLVVTTSKRLKIIRLIYSRMFKWPMELLNKIIKRDEMFCIQCDTYEHFIVIGQTILIMSTFRML